MDVKGQTNAVLDTSVVSILFGDTSKSPLYRKELVGLGGVVSFQTLEEVWFGAFLAGWGTRRRAELASHLNQYPVIWPNADLVDRCARLRTATRAVGKELTTADAWIAATAIMLGCPLASDDGDFDRIPGLEVIRIE